MLLSSMKLGGCDFSVWVLLLLLCFCFDPRLIGVSCGFKHLVSTHVWNCYHEHWGFMNQFYEHMFKLGGNCPPTRYDCVFLLALTQDWLENLCWKMDLWFLWCVCFWWMSFGAGEFDGICFQEGRYAGGWWIYQQTWVDWISNSQWWNCLWLLLSTKQCRLFYRRRCTSFVG